jgi:hypothetical protein
MLWVSRSAEQLRRVGALPMSDSVSDSDADDSSSDPRPSGASSPLLSSRTQLQLDILNATLRTSNERADSRSETTDSGDAGGSDEAMPDASP